MPDAIKKELIDIAADLLCGPNPSIPYIIPYEGIDRASFAFECAKEMLIEHIKEREFDDMTGGKIGVIVRRREHKHIKGNG